MPFSLPFSLVDTLLPDTCILCRSIIARRHAHLCCSSCWASLPRSQNICRHCASATIDGEICGSCLVEPLSSGIAAVAFSYANEAITLVSALKFQNNVRAARTLAHGILDRVEHVYGSQSALPEVVIPTPMSWQRQLIRGYNQSARLAAEVSNELDIPTLALLKRRHGPSQHGRSRSARQSMPLSTFKFLGEPPSHVALIDDVITTGTTMKTMAAICSRAGVRRVDLWAACRTPE